MKSGFQLVDEEEQAEHEPEPEPQGEGEEYDIERAIQMSLESFQTTGQAPIGGVAICELVAEATRQLPMVEGKGKAIATDETTSQIHYAETGAKTDKLNSEGDTEILNISEEQGEDVTNQVNLEDETAKIDEGQADINPSSPCTRDFFSTTNPQVHESLKHPDEEHAQVENPLSSTGTLSSMKNLDPFTFGDQFFNDKPTEKGPDKANIETKVESMVTVLIYQASSSVPPLSTPVIDLTPPKHVSPTIQTPIFTATTITTTTTLPLPPLPQQQSSSDPDLASRVSTLEQVCANFKKKHKLQDNIVQGLSSRVFTLELRDLPHMIDETVCEAIKEVVHVALQASLRDRFRELPEADMKEILHQRMFESGTYKSLPEHVALYEALEASMKCANRDEFLAKKDKSRKRRHDDQDPPPHPPSDSDLSKKKRYDSVEDVPIPDDINISDSEDTDAAHLPKIKTRPDWLKPILEEDRPTTPEPDWTGDMSSFINWFCKRIGKKKLRKADLEGPAFKVV
ncbi:hypothetical protein Tco_0071610 [Tanacetum coccineum]